MVLGLESKIRGAILLGPPCILYLGNLRGNVWRQYPMSISQTFRTAFLSQEKISLLSALILTSFRPALCPDNREIGLVVTTGFQTRTILSLLPVTIKLRLQSEITIFNHFPKWNDSKFLDAWRSQGHLQQSVFSFSSSSSESN